jgi:hypothetical protein
MIKSRPSFETLRPYDDGELNDAFRRITAHPHFSAIAGYIFPERSLEEISEDLLSVRTSFEFQKKYMHKGIRVILDRSSDGLSCSGFENIRKGKPCLYISNHRDIFLDSGILQILLVEHELETTEITFGSNLMDSPFLVDFGKVNRMFSVLRTGSKRELYENALLVSAYIRYVITTKKVSVWISQRNGRTKDGNDKTQDGVLKMLAMNSRKGFLSDFVPLNIIAVSVSYEYEPCDFLKVRELYLSKNATYNKKPGEDLGSILAGVYQHKGRIHLALSEPFNKQMEYIDGHFPEAGKIPAFTKEIDRTIYKNYKLWKTNYIASDLLEDKNSFTDHYSREEKEQFITYMTNGLSAIEGTKGELEEIFLNIYSNPVKNLKAFKYE